MTNWGSEPRNVFRRSDIVGALAAYIFTTHANGGTIDYSAIKALCLAFGIEAAEVGERLQGLRINMPSGA